KQGIKVGDKLVNEGPTRTGRLATERVAPGGARPGQFRGTQGESATPQMTYTPPADNRRRPGRGGGRKGRPEPGGRFAERDVELPTKRTIQERILEQVGQVDTSNLKSVRLTDGATVREFAEALGVTPRDIVQLLMQRKVLATLNQPINEN